MAKERQPHHKESWLLTCMEKEHQAKRAAMLDRLAEKDEEYRTKLRRQESVRQMATAGSDQNESSDALQRIITALGCECEDHADSVDCVLDAIKVHTQTLDRYREQLEFATQREHDIRTVLECDLEEPTFTVAERRMAVLRRIDEIYNVTDDQRIELDKQVSTLTAENNRLAQLLEDQNDALACAISGASEYTELSSYTMNPEREALADFGLRVLAGRVRLEVV